MKNKTELYALLTRLAESYTKNEQTLTRFEMLKIMCEFGFELNLDTIDMVEKLYADGFVKE